MRDVVGIGIDLTQHVPLVSVAVCPPAFRSDGTLDATALSRHWPPKLELSGSFHPQVPCAVLPIHSGEPLLVADAAAGHRRSSGLPWPPEAQAPYDNDAKSGVARIPLTAAWISLLPLAGEEEALSRRDDPEFRWHPEGREHAAHAGQILAASLKAFLSAAKVPFTSRLTTIVVPDALDEAGQQILLESLSQAGMATDNIHLLPRPLAVALNWCRTADAPVPMASEEEAGTPVGRLRVLTTALDLWEAVSLELRARRHAGRVWLVPVRDRARLGGALPELQTPGLSFALALARAETNGVPFSWWHRVFASDWLVRRLAAPRDLSPQDIQSLREVHSASPPDGLRHEFAQIEMLRPLWSRFFQGGPSLREAVVQCWATQERQVGATGYPCTAVLADGALASLRMEHGAHLGGFFVQQVAARESLSSFAGHTAAVNGAAVAAAAIASGLPCYRETLLPLDLYFIGRSERGDPFEAWQQLVEAGDVEAGREWSRPKPLKGLALPEQKPRMTLTLRRQIGQEIIYRKVETALMAPLPEEEPVSITASVRPGQGYAKVRVTSERPGLFTQLLDWKTMENRDKPLPITFAYVPGVAIMEPEPERFYAAEGSLRRLVNLLPVTNGA